MHRTPLTKADILSQLPAADQATQRGDESEPRARAATYDAASGRVFVELTNGLSIGFVPDFDPVLRSAGEYLLADVRVEPGGEGLSWPRLDVHVSLPGLIAHVLDIPSWAPKYISQPPLASEAAGRGAGESQGARSRKSA